MKLTGKFAAFALALLFVGLCFSACSEPSVNAEDNGKIKVGIVFDIGGKNDRSFNAAAWEGVKRAQKDFEITLRDVEPGNPTSIEPAMRAFAETKFRFDNRCRIRARSDYGKKWRAIIRISNLRL